MTDPFAPIGGAGAGGGRKDPPQFVSVVPVPPDAPSRPTHHRDLGEPSRSWAYRGSGGELFGYVHRFDTAEGKSFRPQVVFRPIEGGKPSWRWYSWDAPGRPLYGLDRLAAEADATVVVCEGEKSADAALALLPDHVAVTSPAGSKSAAQADWSPLRGRRVIIWPDADAAGGAYADAVSGLLHRAGAASIAILSLPSGTADGWDAADALAEGWDTGRATAFLASAKPALQVVSGGKGKRKAKSDPSNGESEEGGPAPRRRPQRDVMMDATEGCQFWAGADGECYVTFPKNGHGETWPIRSTMFRRWLRNRVFRETSATPGNQAVEDALLLCEAIASEGDMTRETWRRVGRAGDRIYIDLCDDDWRGVEIGPDGWNVLENHKLPFTRNNPMLPMPEPYLGGMIEALRWFVNVRDESDFVLVVAWLMMALRPDGPYPILVVNGEQGSGKSNLCRLLRSLVDPNKSPIRAAPMDERDVFVAADNSHCLVFDNISKVDPWLANALCRVATGGGFATRQLHSDRGETVFNVTRPVILNGIPSLTDRPDLAERTIKITLATIEEDRRQSEAEWWASWLRVYPVVLGALYDAASRGLGGIAKGITLPTLPRMADFARWVVACEPGLGWETGTFLRAYADNRQDVTDTTFEADPVAVAIRAMMSEPNNENGWTGTATDLLTALGTHVSQAMQKSRSWPFNAQGLGNRIDRVKPLLRSKGLTIERKHSGTRNITIVWKPL